MALDPEKLDALRIDESERSGSNVLGRIAMWLLLIVIIGAAAFALWRFAKSGGDSDNPPPLRTATAQAPRQSDAGVLDASGYVVARRLATVSSKVTGRVEEVLIEEGMSVMAGQLLARLDDSSVQPLLALAEAQLESRRRGLAEIEVRLAEAQRQLDRTRQLRERKLVAEAALDAA
ncbi:MAG: biotin/lipoyl-binding protein, partial [Gammaproteobacteria bacterium]|nr:biotin/lipoyl-binding protein [Gammaproteobacteria bacterium]